MKVFLVDMQNIESYWAREAFKRIEEAEAVTPVEGMAADGSLASPPPPPSEAYIDSAKHKEDLAHVLKWRRAIACRKELLERIDITIPNRSVAEDATEFQASAHLSSPTFACSSEQLIEIMSSNDSCTVKSVSTSDTSSTMLDRLERVLAKIEESGIANLTGPVGDQIYNTRCDVHMPGQALASYNETLLLEDSCTDALQGSLNSGWRVIAACPQPNQRRPDYILGRFNPDFDAGGGASRKP